MATAGAGCRGATAAAPIVAGTAAGTARGCAVDERRRAGVW
ncbi:MAG TPA: hypothetical protein PKJ99_15430 [Thermoanaerobaculales bacterium]|nr:hypothetical protein [Thermoanaerobaculales bacterium]HQL30392.1 hypothetical protein [Thermoanaerobaculales bacterium]HQN95847.1 hypothetical protein [Thermoanaerobaculales bacterium]HQP44718.1 hypothetical protein [Thermoanaerobaculales bacterium]